MEGFFIETTYQGRRADRRAVAVQVLGEVGGAYRVRPLVDCVTPSRRRVAAGQVCLIPRAYLRMAERAIGGRAGDQTIVAVTLHSEPTERGGAEPVRRTLPGVVMSHDELVARLGRKSYTLQTIEG